MKLYKLTDSTYQTHNGTAIWGKGATNSVKTRVDKPQLCTNEVIHAYRNSNLALLLNPIHAGINKPVLWEAEGEVVVEDWGKTGGYELTTVKRLPLPEWYKKKTLRKRVQILFAILCAESVLKFYEDEYPQDDRPRQTIKATKEYLKHPSKKAADAAYAAARAAAYAAARAAADAAAHAACAAARAAAHAACAAADAACAAARAAAYAAARAAHAAAYAAARAAADAAAHAACAAARAAAHAACAAADAACAAARAAAYAAARAAHAAAYAAARAADAAAYAADAAAYAAAYAAADAAAPDFGKFADKAVRMIMKEAKKEA